MQQLLLWHGIVFPNQGEEVTVIDDWSALPHFGYLLCQLLLLCWAQPLASLAIASLLLSRWFHGVANKEIKYPQELFEK